MTDDASVASATSATSSAAGGVGSKTRIEDELNLLRERGPVKTQRGKYKSADASGLMTPEEARAYLAAQRVAQSRKAAQLPAPPSSGHHPSSSADLDAWFVAQKRREAEERMRREEAEAILRGYKGHYVGPAGGGGEGARKRASLGGGGAAAAAAADIDESSVDARGFFRDAEAASGGTWLPPMPRQERRRRAAGSGADALEPADSVFPDAPPSVGSEENAEAAADIETAEAKATAAEAESSEAAPAASDDEGEGKEDDDDAPEPAALSSGALGATYWEVRAGISADGAEEAAAVAAEAENEEGVEEEGGSTAPPASDDEWGLAKDDGPAPSEEEKEPIGTKQEKDRDAVPPVAKSEILLAGSEEEKKLEEDVLGQEVTEPEVSKGTERPKLDSAFHNFISSEEGAPYPPEKGRYHLVVSYACPWAHRTLMVRALKGLRDAVPATAVHPVWQRTRPDDPDDGHRGWIFGDPAAAERGEASSLADAAGLGGRFPAAYGGKDPDPIMGARSVRELYEAAGEGGGKCTVPLLWDTKSGTIVSTESCDIMRMLNSSFNEFAENPELDLCPEKLRDEIDSANGWINPTINNGVYRCGFATTQAAYDLAIDELTQSFDRIESLLQEQRFIAGDAFTEADVRLFVTLLRFDEVYSVYFKTNTRSVASSPAMLNYCRNIYQMKGVAETCDMEQIKAHYYCSHVELNRYSIVPRGPDFVRLLKQPHNRGFEV